MKRIFLVFILFLVSLSLYSCDKEIKYVDYDYDIVYPTIVSISSFSGNGRYMFRFIDCKDFEYEVYYEYKVVDPASGKVYELTSTSTFISNHSSSSFKSSTYPNLYKPYGSFLHISSVALFIA